MIITKGICSQIYLGYFHVSCAKDAWNISHTQVS